MRGGGPGLGAWDMAWGHGMGLVVWDGAGAVGQGQYGAG